MTYPISGNKLYQARARQALPILVRQAKAGKSIIYSYLAQEIGMPNPRNLNRVLGCIGQSLEKLMEDRNEVVPPIQCLVKNKMTGLPEEGVGWFVPNLNEYRQLSLVQQRMIVDAELVKVYAYQKWMQVLEVFGLSEIQSDFNDDFNFAAGNVGGGESDAHKAIKEFVANNPTLVGVSARFGPGKTEHPLPSGDSLDVSFMGKKIWVAAEVKPSSSNETDIKRGIYQCVKYLAVMEAVQRAASIPQNARAVLVLGGPLPQSLIALRNILGVEVIENVRP